MHSALRLRSIVIVGLTQACLWCPVRAEEAAQQLPPGVAGLLPASATLDGSSWGVFETEFGKTFNGDMRATLPGRRLSCDSTSESELTASLKGDTAWEAPPMLEMAVQMFDADIVDARTSLPERIGRLRAGNNDISSASALKEEQLANGHLLYIDYAESCADYGNGTNTLLRGFARKGATTLTFDLWLSAGAAEATALAKDVLSRFEKLDVPALLR